MKTIVLEDNYVQEVPDTQPTITAAIIGSTRFTKRVIVMMEDTGEFEELFEYYPDEIRFDGNEFIGLTKHEALELHKKKDMAYLRS